MSDKLFGDHQFIVSQSEFIKELTSSGDHEEGRLGKRLPPAEGLAGTSSPRRLLVVQKAFSDCVEGLPAVPQVFYSGLDEISSVTSPTPSEDHFDQATNASTLESANADDKYLKQLMQNQFECHKVLVKHFLFETIINEKFNVTRFNILPSSCQRLASNFLRTHFNFNVEVELRAGSHKKQLYGLHGRQYPKVQGSGLSLSFLADCYLYGLRKQLMSAGRSLDQKQTIQTLHRALFPQAETSHLDLFEEAIEKLLRYDSEESEEGISAILSYPLLAKMSQISEQTLRKFYSVKLHKCLSLLIDDSKSPAELKQNFGSRKQTIDILSAYIGLEKDLPRQYRISMLQINNNNSSI